MHDNVSMRVVEQRLRNRIIEQMDALVDWRDTLEKVGVKEYFEMFFDFFPYEGEPSPLPTMTAEEALAVREVHRLMAEAIQGYEETNAELEASGWPQRIAPVAAAALQLLCARGWFSEEHEEAEPSRPLPAWITRPTLDA